MAVMLPTTTLFADSAAAGMLYARGSVMLNGNRLDASSAVFSGDKVQTGEESAVAITANGATVLIPASSSVVMGRNSLDLLCGTAFVATTSGMGAQVANLSVAPAGETAKFEVTQSPTELRVTAREGSLSITDGREALTLEAGQSMTASGGCFTGAMYDASATTTSPAPAASSAMLAPAAVVLIIAGIAAAVGVGIYYAVRDTSPDQP